MSAKLVETIKASSSQFQAQQKIFVAFSGGVDSHVILDLLTRHTDMIVDAVHINHGLQDMADAFEGHCRQVCVGYQIPCHVLRVVVDIQGDGMEAAARKARRRALQSFLNEDDVVVFAQHAEDQSETVLLQLFRGSGVAGLAAMAELQDFGRGKLWRPLLGISRQEILHYAHERNLRWIEDPSNQNTQIERNYLRHKIIPHLIERWPHLNKSLQRTAKHCAMAKELLEDLAADDLSLVINEDDSLGIKELAKLDHKRQVNLLRYWLKHLGASQPSSAQLEKLFEDVIAADHDANPLLRWGNVEIHRYQHYLYAEPAQEKLDISDCYAWNLQSILSLPHRQFSAMQVLGRGVAVSKIISEDKISVRFRMPGLRIHPAERIDTHPLKKLFQEWKVPPWQRDEIPLLYYGEEIIAVLGYCVCEGWQALDDELGWLIVELNPKCS